MKQQRKVIHVELVEPPTGYKKHYYFGSVAAIFDTLPEEVVGISKRAIWNALQDGEHKGRKAIIRKGVLAAKETERGIRKEE